MRKFLLIAISSAVLIPTAMSSAVLADPAKVEAAMKTFEEVGKTPEKIAAYCAMVKKMEEVGEDEAKAEAANAEMEGYFKTLGPDFENAWSAGDELKEGDPELETLDNAMAKLDESCKS